MRDKIEITSRQNQPNYTGVWPRPSPHMTKDVKRNVMRRQKRKRQMYTTDQLIILEKAYRDNKYIKRLNRAEMSQVLNVSERCITLWFQNRRQKEKKIKIENELVSNKVNLPKYEIKISSPNQRADLTEIENGYNIQFCIPSKVTNSTTYANGDGSSTNNLNHFNLSPVHYSPNLQSHEGQTINFKSDSNSVTTSLLPKSSSPNLEYASDFIAKETRINEILTDLCQGIQTNSICNYTSPNQSFDVQKSYESSSSSFTNSLTPSSQNDIRKSSSNSYSSLDAIALALSCSMEDANESVNDMTSVNFGQVLQSNTSYDNYHKTSCKEEKTHAMGTSSLSAVFNNETERCSPYSNNVSNEYYNESHVNLGQENQSDLVYYNPYQY
ncbi:hypothetical protein SFRURICE_010947, partial [Spodoptera frugiperda]